MQIVRLVPMPMPVPVLLGGREAKSMTFERADAVRITLRHQPMAVPRRPAFLRERPFLRCAPFEV